MSTGIFEWSAGTRISFLRYRVSNYRTPSSKIISLTAGLLAWHRSRTSKVNGRRNIDPRLQRRQAPTATHRNRCCHSRLTATECTRPLKYTMRKIQGSLRRPLSTGLCKTNSHKNVGPQNSLRKIALNVPTLRFSLRSLVVEARHLHLDTGSSVAIGPFLHTLFCQSPLKIHVQCL